MQLEMIILSEVRKTNSMISLTHGILKCSRDEHIYKKENRPTDMENGLVVAKEKRMGRERNGLGVWGWKIQSIIIKINKVLMYSSGTVFNIL